MIFYTYIIYSSTLDRYYTGHCETKEERLNRHNSGKGATYTKKAKDWELKWSKKFDSRSEASRKEMEIKKKKSRKYIEYLIVSSNEG